MAEPIQWREPESFVSGDTLLFQRNLPDYLPSDGWAIRLTVSKPLANGIETTAQVTSTPDATNQFHCFNEPDFCADAGGGVYILSAEVFHAGTGAKHQIYHSANFVIGDDLNDGNASGPVQTEAQTMIALLQNSLKDLYKLKYAETEVQRNRFKLQDQTRVLQDLKYWKSVRINEIQVERARNGQCPGNVQEAVFQIG